MAITRYNGRGRIGPSFRGKLYEYESNGRRIIASWPKPRGKPVSEKQALSQKAFKEVAEAVKRTAAEIQNFHRLAAAGTPMLPRDTLFAALYGNGPTIKLYDGRIIKPMANKYLSSTVLDAIGWQEGAMLYRGPETWDAIPPGLPEQVLTLDGAGKPYWSTPSISGGGGGQWLVQPLNSDSTGAGAARAFPFSPIIDMTMDAVWFYQSGLAGYTYSIGIYEVDASRVITRVKSVFPVPCICDGTRRKVVHRMDTPVVLEAGKVYAIALIATHGTDATATRCSIASAYPTQVPTNEILQGWNLAKKSPAIGDAFTVSGTTTFIVYPRVG